jgi:hypothetical protein
MEVGSKDSRDRMREGFFLLWDAITMMVKKVKSEGNNC